MEHVNESLESQILSQWIVDQPLLGHKAPLPGDNGWRDRLEWCPACRGLLPIPVLMSSRHALFLSILFRCLLPKAMSISRSEILRKKKAEETENVHFAKKLDQNFRDGLDLGG